MKRAMKVTITEYPVESTISQYNCPACKCGIRCAIDNNVTRFKCIRCARELIISSRRKGKVYE
jgi:predicted RNA-binding Zn-ribbon protein involved in translation (DUF1610 family)